MCSRTAAGAAAAAVPLFGKSCRLKSHNFNIMDFWPASSVPGGHTGKQQNRFG